VWVSSAHSWSHDSQHEMKPKKEHCVLKKSGWPSWSSGHLSFLILIFITHCSCSLICSFVSVCPDLILVPQIVHAICSHNPFFFVLLLIGQLLYWHHRLFMPSHCTHFQVATSLHFQRIRSCMLNYQVQAKETEWNSIGKTPLPWFKIWARTMKNNKHRKPVTSSKRTQCTNACILFSSLTV